MIFAPAASGDGSCTDGNWHRYWLPLGIYTVGVPFYGVFLYLLQSRSKDDSRFQSAYFRLSIWDGAGNLLSCCHSWLLVRLRSWGVLPGVYHWFDPFLARQALTLQFQLIHTQALGVLLVTWNRYTAIRQPNLHQRVWSPGFFYFGVGCQFLLPLIAFQPLHPSLNADISSQSNDTSCMRVVYQNPKLIAVCFVATSVVLTVECGFMLFLYIRILFGIVRYKEGMETTTNADERITLRLSTQATLALSGFLQFLAFSLAVLFLNLMVIELNFSKWYPYYTTAGDLLNLSRPVLVTMCSPLVRSCFTTRCWDRDGAVERRRRRQTRSYFATNRTATGATEIRLLETAEETGTDETVRRLPDSDVLL